LPSGREFFIKPFVHMVRSLDTALGQNFDIIHCHYTTLADLIMLGLTRHLKNCLFTAHNNFCEINQGSPRDLAFHTFPTAPFISISNSQRTKGLNFVKTIYHGINIDLYQFCPAPKTTGHNDYMFWIGRISPQKGIVEALKTSRRSGKKLLFTATINNQDSQTYFSQSVEPLLDDSNTIPVPELDLAGKNRYFQNAKLFLFPLRWEEPFGLTLIESMACGTPVVTFARGSVPEIVKDGETGFIVNPEDDDIRGSWIIKKTGIEGLCEAVQRIYSMPENEYHQMRANCRQHVEANFTVERMVDEYERVYYEVLKKQR